VTGAERRRVQGSVVPVAEPDRPIEPGVTIGHVHLRTADIDRVRDFYVGVLGFEVVAEARGVPGWGTTGDILFVSAGGYHHHVGLNTWESRGGTPAPPGHTGLYHHAIVLPTRKDLATVVKRVMDSGWPLTGASDHLTHEAIYLDDPDGNGIELYWDRPQEQWPRKPDGNLTLVGGHPLNLRDLLEEAI
jgi:catechol 2,3-dioxygenase